MKYNFNEVINRKDTNSVKWDSLSNVFNTSKVIPLWVADMDFPCAVEIIEAIKSRSNHGILGYNILPDSYYSAIINWVKKRFNWNIKKQWITHSPGIVPALNLCVLTYTKPGDKILVQSPVYFPFFAVIENNQRQLINSELKLINGKYFMDFDDLEIKFKAGVKMMILCNPQNPVGRVWSHEELIKLSELCVKYNVLIISDEIHCDLVHSGYKHTPIASLSNDISKLTVTCMAPSKTFNIAGLSTATIIIPNEDLLSKYNKTIENLGLGLGNTFGIVALEAAYNYGEPWLQQVLAYIEENFKFLDEYLKTYIPQIKLVKPEGTFLAWLDFRELNMTNNELKDFIIFTAGVGLNNGSDFGKSGEGFQRMNIACSRKTLEEALKNLQNAVSNLNNSF